MSHHPGLHHTACDGCAKPDDACFSCGCGWFRGVAPKPVPPPCKWLPCDTCTCDSCKAPMAEVCARHKGRGGMHEGKWIKVCSLECLEAL